MLLADATSPHNLFDYIQAGGVVALLLIIIWGGKQKWWVFGWYYNELKDRHVKLAAERDSWKELALRSTNLAESLDQIARSKTIP